MVAVSVATFFENGGSGSPPVRGDIVTGAPDIDFETGQLTWPDGSAIQLDLTDDKRKAHLIYDEPAR